MRVPKGSVPEQVMVGFMAVVFTLFIGVMFILGTMLFWQNKDMILKNFTNRVVNLEENQNYLYAQVNALMNDDYGHGNEYR